MSLSRQAMPRLAAAAGISFVLAVSAGCGGGGGDGHTRPTTALGRALASTGTGGETAPAVGFGWIDLEELRGAAVPAQRAGAETLAWAGSALGPGAGELTAHPAAVERLTGLDLTRARRLMALAGSYAFGLRVDGIDPRRLQRLLRAAGATTLLGQGSWKRLDLAQEGQVPSRLEGTPMGAFGARVATETGSVILARTEEARSGLMGDGRPLGEDPRYALAARCVGDVEVVRMLPGGFTYAPQLRDDLLAVGTRLSGNRPDRETVCAVGGSARSADRQVAALRRSLGKVNSAHGLGVQRIDDGQLHAARAELELSPGSAPGFLLRALDSGDLERYLGAPRPVAGGLNR